MEEEEDKPKVPMLSMHEELEQYRETVSKEAQLHIINCFMTIWGRTKHD